MTNEITAKNHNPLMYIHVQTVAFIWDIHDINYNKKKSCFEKKNTKVPSIR